MKSAATVVLPTKKKKKFGPKQKGRRVLVVPSQPVVRLGARPARKIPLISRAIAVEAGTVAPTDFDLPVPPTEAEFQPSTETVPSVEDLPIMPEEVVIEEESFFQENKRLVLIGGAVAAGLVALLILRR